MGFDDERTDEFDEVIEDDKDITDEFEVPEEAQDLSAERQLELRKIVYPHLK